MAQGKNTNEDLLKEYCKDTKSITTAAIRLGHKVTNVTQVNIIKVFLMISRMEFVNTGMDPSTSSILNASEVHGNMEKMGYNITYANVQKNLVLLSKGDSSILLSSKKINTPGRKVEYTVRPINYILLAYFSGKDTLEKLFFE